MQDEKSGVQEIQECNIREQHNPAYDEWVSSIVMDLIESRVEGFRQAMVGALTALPVTLINCSTKWFGVVRWCAGDVIAAAEQNGIVLTEAQAEKWLEKNERWFKEMLTEYGNEVLASASKESFEEVLELS